MLQPLVVDIVPGLFSLGPGESHAGPSGRPAEVMSLVHGMLAGGESIDDMNVLRAGSTQLILGHRVMARSTLGTFLRAFTFGHVRQLDHVLDQSLARAWEAGTGPGDGPLVIDIDSFIGEICGDHKRAPATGTPVRSATTRSRPSGLIPVRLLKIRSRKGKANTQRGASRFVD